MAAEAEVLGYCHAWRDSDGDADAKVSYKFPHHKSSGGPAFVRACQQGIAILNGARGGSSIPDSDRQGVYNHLARHLRGRSCPRAERGQVRHPKPVGSHSTSARAAASPG
jgi:hypothetical protein